LALWKTVITDDGIGGGGGGGTGRLTDNPDPALERTGDDTREPPSRCTPHTAPDGRLRKVGTAAG